jgi:uncharacterized protein YndB with AHSA1/START domain
MSNHTSISKITINASAARVWAALTQPELVKQWQFGSLLSTDWQKGSPIVFRNEWEGTVFEQKGTVLEVEPNKLARYTLFAPRPDLTDSPENYFTMTYLLEEKNGKTTLSIIQDDPRPQSEPAEEDGSGILDGLKKLVEG